MMRKSSLNKIVKKFENLEQPLDYKLIPLTQGKFTKVDNDDFYKFKDFNWWFNTKGYAVGFKCILHRLIMDSPKGMSIDHINHDRLDNRKSNLRVCTKHQNSMNIKPLIGTSEYKGVYLDKSRNKWKVNIKFKGKQIYLGRFDNELEAAKSYDVKAKELFGEFAHLNFT